jgi:hypothetical protein
MTPIRASAITIKIFVAFNLDSGSLKGRNISPTFRSVMYTVEISIN